MQQKFTPALIAEKISVLSNCVDGLLPRLHYCVTRSASETFGHFKFHDYEKLKKKLVSKFPDLPSNISSTSGFDVFKTKAPEILRELHQPYWAFVHTNDFLLETHQFFTDFNKSVLYIGFDKNPVLAATFMKLFVGYCKVFLLASAITNRRSLLGFYALAFKIVRNSNETSFEKVASAHELLNQGEKGQQTSLDFLNGHLSALIMSVGMEYLKTTTAHTSPVCDQFGFTSLKSPLELKERPSNKNLFNLAWGPKQKEWIIYSVLFCPQCVSKIGVMDYLKAALSDGFVLPIYRDYSILIHDHFLQLFSWYKSNIKPKPTKSVAEAGSKAVLESPHVHRERRIFFRHLLRQYLHIFTERPQLMGPNAPLIYAAMSLAAEEIFWYFAHQGRKPGKAKGKYEEKFWIDTHIVNLLYYYIRFNEEVVYPNYNLICKTVIHNIHTQDVPGILPQVKEFLSNTKVDSATTTLVNSIHDANLVLSSAPHHIEQFKLDWFRFVGLFASRSSPVPIQKIPFVSEVSHVWFQSNMMMLHEFCPEITDIIFCTELAKDGTTVNSVGRLFEHNIENTAIPPSRVASLFYLIRRMVSRIHPHYTAEYPYLLARAHNLAKTWSKRMISILHKRHWQLAGHLGLKFDQFTDSSYAVKRELPDLDVPDAKYPLLEPGTESIFASNNDIDQLTQSMIFAAHVASAFKLLEKPIHRLEFYPSTLVQHVLANILASKFSGWLTSSYQDPKSKSPGYNVLTPTKFVRKFESVTSYLHQITDFIDIPGYTLGALSQFSRKFNTIGDYINSYFKNFFPQKGHPTHGFDYFPTISAMEQNPRSKLDRPLVIPFNIPEFQNLLSWADSSMLALIHTALLKQMHSGLLGVFSLSSKSKSQLVTIKDTIASENHPTLFSILAKPKSEMKETIHHLQKIGLAKEMLETLLFLKRNNPQSTFDSKFPPKSTFDLMVLSAIANSQFAPGMTPPDDSTIVSRVNILSDVPILLAVSLATYNYRDTSFDPNTGSLGDNYLVLVQSGIEVVIQAGNIAKAGWDAQLSAQIGDIVSASHVSNQPNFNTTFPVFLSSSVHTASKESATSSYGRVAFREIYSQPQ